MTQDEPVQDVQGLILNHVVNNEEYMRKCIPHLKKEYFDRKETQILFDEISNYVAQCNTLPSKEAILINLSKREEMRNEDLAHRTISTVKAAFSKHDEVTSIDWLLNTTEHWCQERAIYNSIIESISIIDGKDKGQRSKHAIPKILQEALAVSFNNYVGHDYLENFENRFDFYHHKEDRIPFDIDLLNRITRGGLPRKTINILMGGPGIGKSLILCHFASSYLLQSRNVLYVTLEMSEERIAERIDANLMNVALNDLYKISKPVFKVRIETITEKTKGRLIIKEYPTGSAHTGHFRALLNELKMKKNFVPDVILIDYLNICSSSRIKAFSGAVNSYSFVKAIVEEVRGLAIEYDVPVLSATQVNRCLALDTKIFHNEKGEIEIKDVKKDDNILSSGGNFVKVTKVYPIEKQKVYRIKTKSGKEIVCSDLHLFPTTEGLCSISSGLRKGDFLFSR